MSQAKSFWEHPIEKLEEALHIRKQIATLQDKLKSLFASAVEEPVKAALKPRKKGRRSMSPEAREKIAAAQRARWAKSRSPKAAVVTVAKAHPAPKAKASRNFSPEARAKMAAAARRRWAKVKQGK